MNVERKIGKSLMTFGLIAFGTLLMPRTSPAQTVQEVVQKKQFGKDTTVRELHYAPRGNDFVLVSGKRRFNRALYGTNTGFRVEAGDLPELALYMPGMGGNLQWFFLKDTKKKAIIQASDIRTTYRPGAMIYEIRDPWLGNGKLELTVLAMADSEGMIIRVKSEKLPSDVRIGWVFGGASGKTFSRHGDIGADPESSFYLKPENCVGNQYSVSANRFRLTFAGGKKVLEGIYPGTASLTDASAGETAFFGNTKPGTAPIINGILPLSGNKQYHLCIYNPDGAAIKGYNMLPALYARAEQARKALADRVVLETPDPYINTLGGALSMAADAIWEDPTYLHGAVAWRMRLNAWRGAYVADQLGWHDRAKAHFSSYAKSQLTEPPAGPVVADTALHLARQQEKIGNSMFSSGYICRNPNGDIRPHHYDMNLVFIDQLLTHFNHTGDTAYLREMWPVVERHLDWEKRNFDTDNDGLYDAYCCIWASDALQYSGGGVAHSTAYNYRANLTAATLAGIIGKDGSRYRDEARKIREAVQAKLWLNDKGWFAEYIDRAGNKLVHPAAGLWTIYHLMESGLPDPQQRWKMLSYIDDHIPHLSVKVKQLPHEDLFLLSTTNWQPYTWSVNNVALAEVLHTALAYWQGERSEKAFRLWRSALIESMYMSASPGGFQQLSWYDEARGELYRDFADPIGVAARSLVEGLFGITPMAFLDTLFIKPGLPSSWNNARLRLPQIEFAYSRVDNKTVYRIIQQADKLLNLDLRIPANSVDIKSVKVNGKNVSWEPCVSVGSPRIRIAASALPAYTVEILWGEEEPVSPQEIVITDDGNNAGYVPGRNILFEEKVQGGLKWLSPKTVWIKPLVEIRAPHEQAAAALQFTLFNNGKQAVTLQVSVNNKLIDTLELPAGKESNLFTVSSAIAVPGTNRIQVKALGSGYITSGDVVNWNISSKAEGRSVDISAAFNDSVPAIFRQQYLSPRPAIVTLQLPWQGIGNWCYPLIQPEISDKGLRAIAAAGRKLSIHQGIGFATPASGDNIVYTSLWDNYPDSVAIPVTGNAAHAYFLMTGSTNHMQSQLVNGFVKAVYKDGTETVLELRNPETWWPIEQDYINTGGAFALNKPAPPRIELKTGKQIGKDFHYYPIKGFSNMGIDGGAATVLDLPLDPNRTLSHLVLKAHANEVVIGLMAVTLVD